MNGVAAVAAANDDANVVALVPIPVRRCTPLLWGTVHCLARCGDAGQPLGIGIRPPVKSNEIVPYD